MKRPSPKPRQPSLKARLIVRQLILQFLAIAAAAIGFIFFFVNSTLDGMYADESVAQIAAEAIVRDAAGAAVVQMTPALAELRRQAPELWFAVRLSAGAMVYFGNVPEEFASLVPHLDRLSSADIRGKFAPYRLSAIVRQVSGPVGDMHIIAHGQVQPFTTLITMASHIVVITMFLTLALVSVLATPWIVKNTLAGVIKTADQTRRVDAERRGVRLSEDDVPCEIRPLVRGFNEALGRLDEGYERQQRFIASAAHELRTPIAVLRMKIESSDDQRMRSLLLDVSRLANLSEQLLDLHRLDNGAPRERIDPAPLARSVAADLAPLLIAAGKTIEVIAKAPEPIVANAGAFARALTNLIQNALELGGDQVTVRVHGTRLEVEDNGDGIPEEEHERVFEPFHRLQPRASGTGLGLSLVKQVVDHHHGRITLARAPSGGAIVRLAFPSAP